jgi:predicted esterase/catechol 2,3-dioxygenase-like lactoylglutathione lyase family enzyme
LAELSPETITSFDSAGLRLRDPDGLEVNLIEADDVTDSPWATDEIPADVALRGVHGVTLWVGEIGPTLDVLSTLGFEGAGRNGDVVRYQGTAATGRFVDVREVGNIPRGDGGAGTVHHVAFRVGDDEGELTMRSKIIGLGLSPTEVIDRQYFHSVYFREPGGVLFELATDQPGFDADEPRESLGTELKLPPQYEPHRARIEATLPPLQRHEALGFRYRYQPTPGADRTLLLLHGTGGTEGDLLPLADKLDATAGVLSPRGRIDEHGAARFFRRLREGVFDEDSIRTEAAALRNFLHDRANALSFDGTKLDAVGYSNGANIAAALLLLHGDVPRSAVLLRPMVPLVPSELPDLAGRRVLISAGRHDPICPPEEAERLTALLRQAGADVELVWQDADHRLTPGDLDAARTFLKS